VKRIKEREGYLRGLLVPLAEAELDAISEDELVLVTFSVLEQNSD
jgi:hypothetical protein